MSRFRNTLLALAGLAASASLCLTSHADDLLARAAAHLRDRNYREAADLARTAADTPQRTFLQGVAAHRLGRFEEALPLLKEAEQKLPVVGDYALLYQVEALSKLKRFDEASARAAGFAKTYPGSLVTRRVDKLAVDALVASGSKEVLKACQDFLEKYPSGSDSIEVVFQSARSREEVDDKGGAAQIYRSIWLNNPSSPLARKSRERLSELEKSGFKVAPFTTDELLRRASALYAQNQFSLSLQTLQAIPLQGQPPGLTGRVELRTGLSQYRLRNFKAAEKSLTKAAASGVPGVASEARFWLAKSIERQDQPERALTLYMELAGEGKKQEFAADALMEAAGLKRGQGNFAEAVRLYEQLIRTYPESRFAQRAAWDAAWSRYLAGEYPAAADSFKALLKDETVREKALYWLARALENARSQEAPGYYRALLDEYPAGFYATWHREQKGIRDLREPLGQKPVTIEAAVPPGFEKPRLLASLGLIEEARSEMTAARRKVGDRKAPFPVLARLYLEIADYGSAIALFLQNRPVKWDKASLPLWSAGYPLVYRGAVSQHAASNELSEGLVYALMRAESGFAPTVKSPAGAIGLMQLMPATAKATAQEKGFDAARLTVPDYNIRLGTRHLRDLLKQYDGDVVYAVAAYNAGAAAVDRWRKNLKGLRKDEFIESIPYQETRDYVKKVYASAATYRQLYGLR